MIALVICAATAPQPKLWLPQMAAAAQLIIAVDGGGDACVAAGVSVDHLVGDLDSLTPDAYAVLERAGTRFTRFSTDKDRSDLDLALEHAASLGATEVHVTGAFRGRLDHTLVAVGSIARHSILRPRIVEPDMEGWILQPDARDSVQLDHREGRTVSVLSVDGRAQVSVTGVQWPLHDATLVSLSDWGLSNRVISDPANVMVHEGTVLVTCIDIA